jgi:glycosyltransferase involved in cell wall biosynthesis
VSVRVVEICGYPPPRAGWSMRVEVLKRELDATGHECVVLNIGQNRRVPSPHYETVMNGVDYVFKVWRFARRGYVVHSHANAESVTGLALALVAELLAYVAGTSSVLTFHAGIDQRFFPRGRSRLLFPAFVLLFRLPRVVICNTAVVREKITEFRVPAERIHAIPAFSRQYLAFQLAALPPHADAFLARYPTVIFSYIRVRPGFYLGTLIDGFARVAESQPAVGLLLVGVTEDVDPVVWADVKERIFRYGLANRICIVEELDHDQFLTALTRSALYLRTPVTDGSASSVLESLALRVPVVGAENGTRPAGVVTYRHDDPADLASTVSNVLADLAGAREAIPPVEIKDTIADEIRVLCLAAASA